METVQRTKGGHPKGLYLLFSVEMWERFSYYGNRALLMLYMTKFLFVGMGTSAEIDAKGYGIYGAYGALVYASPAIGGMIADAILGFRRSILIGGILMALGQMTLALPAVAGFTDQGFLFFFTGLALIAVGNGFFKPNISSLVGQLYDPSEVSLKDRGFTIFYMGINMGALIQLICGFLGENYGFHFGFLAAFAGMCLGLGLFFSNQKLLGDKGKPPVGYTRAKEIMVIIGALLMIPVFVFLIKNNTIMDVVMIGVGISVLILILVNAFKGNNVERDRLIVVVILIFFSTLFWAFFEQAGSSISLFTDRNVNRDMGWFVIPTSVFQSVNPAFIVLLAPVFVSIWQALNTKNLEPNTPFKFGLGIIQLGLGFLVLSISKSFANEEGMVPLFFLIAGYLLHTTGELCLSPVGLSMVTKLSPPRMVGLAMGAWFMSSAFAHHLGGMIAKLTASSGSGNASGTSALAGLQIYSDVFMLIAYISLGVGGFLLIVSPYIKKMMHGIK